MLRKFVIALATLIGAIAAIAVVFLVGMRTKSTPVLDTVRRFNRDVVNPEQMKTAGSPGAYASVIRHRGRTTGTPYETPVQAVATDRGFAIPLPYSMQADWVRNVLASGSATIVKDGETHDVDRPEMIRMDELEAQFPPGDQKAHRVFGVDQCLHVRRTEVTRQPAEAVSA